jgi:hypothetical protein
MGLSTPVVVVAFGGRVEKKIVEAIVMGQGCRGVGGVTVLLGEEETGERGGGGLVFNLPPIHPWTLSPLSALSATSDLSALSALSAPSALSAHSAFSTLSTLSALSASSAFSALGGSTIGDGWGGGR